MSQNVHVLARFRPLNAQEAAHDRNDEQSLFNIKENTIEIKESDALFTFDHVFDVNSTQDDVFKFAAEPLVAEVMKGYNTTVFACKSIDSFLPLTPIPPPPSSPLPPLISVVTLYLATSTLLLRVEILSTTDGQTGSGKTVIRFLLTGTLIFLLKTNGRMLNETLIVFHHPTTAHDDGRTGPSSPRYHPTSGGLHFSKHFRCR